MNVQSYAVSGGHVDIPISGTLFRITEDGSGGLTAWALVSPDWNSSMGYNQYLVYVAGDSGSGVPFGAVYMMSYVDLLQPIKHVFIVDNGFVAS